MRTRTDIQTTSKRTQSTRVITPLQTTNVHSMAHPRGCSVVSCRNSYACTTPHARRGPPNPSTPPVRCADLPRVDANGTMLRQQDQARFEGVRGRPPRPQPPAPHTHVHARRTHAMLRVAATHFTEPTAVILAKTAMKHDLCFRAAAAALAVYTDRVANLRHNRGSACCIRRALNAGTHDKQYSRRALPRSRGISKEAMTHAQCAAERCRAIQRIVRGLWSRGRINGSATSRPQRRPVACVEIHPYEGEHQHASAPRTCTNRRTHTRTRAQGDEHIHGRAHKEANTYTDARTRRRTHTRTRAQTDEHIHGRAHKETDFFHNTHTHTHTHTHTTTVSFLHFKLHNQLGVSFGNRAKLDVKHTAFAVPSTTHSSRSRDRATSNTSYLCPPDPTYAPARCARAQTCQRESLTKWTSFDSGPFSTAVRLRAAVGSPSGRASRGRKMYAPLPHGDSYGTSPRGAPRWKRAYLLSVRYLPNDWFSATPSPVDVLLIAAAINVFS